jgi:plasmid stabilization system protein ParE
VTLRVIIENPAKGDLAAAVRWYKQIRPRLEADFRLCVRATIQRIARHPESCPVVGRAMRRALIDRFSFAVFYRPDRDGLRVFAVLHTSRDPRVWQSRGH